MEVRSLQDKYVVLKYLRLSVEDGDNTESDSIANQRNLLDLHVSAIFKDVNNLEVIELIDDGYTGTNMNRPAMQKLIVLAETHQINCVIVKDFSRFARDYVEVGRYIDMLFPEWQIRFISANDGYDSNDYDGATCGIDVAIKNLSYAMYSQDLSDKIKSVKHMQQRKGEFISAYAIYGYMKSPEDKHKLIVDEEAAEIVRRIFNYRANKMTYRNIALILNNEGVLPPSEYKKRKFDCCLKWGLADRKTFWNVGVIYIILQDERYTGKMVSRFKEKPYVGSKQRRVPKEERVVVENTHEAIISQELFDSVQAKPHTKTSTPREKRLLSGLVKCGGCKRNMVQYGKYPYALWYRCGSLGVGINEQCCQESCRESELDEIIIVAVKNELQKASELIDKQKAFKQKAKKHERRIQLLNKEISEMKQQKVDAYIKLTKKQLTEDEFYKIKNDIEEGIHTREEEIHMYSIDSISEEETKQIDFFERFIGVEEYTNEMMKALIKAIYVYDDKRLEIEWNFNDTNSSFSQMQMTL